MKSPAGASPGLGKQIHNNIQHSPQKRIFQNEHCNTTLTPALFRQRARESYNTSLGCRK
jgi:hypothetical protein